MKQSSKAALLSALVFPGTGHVLLKKYLHGTLLMATSFAAAYYLLSEAMDRAVQISEKIIGGELLPDVAAIMDLVSRQSVATDAGLLNYATTVFIICWIIGVVDSYRVGKQLNVMNQS